MTTAPQSQPPIYSSYPHSPSPHLLASFSGWPNTNLLSFPNVVSSTMSGSPQHANSSSHMSQQDTQRLGARILQQPPAHLGGYDIPSENIHHWAPDALENSTSTIAQHSQAQYAYNSNPESYSWACEATAYNTAVDSPSVSYMTHHPSPSTSPHTQSPYPNLQPSMPLPLESPPTSAGLGLSPRNPASRRSSPGTSTRSPESNSLQLITSGVATDRPQYTHRQQLQMFRDVVANNASGGSFGPFIPQLMYKPHTNSDWKRYVEEVETDAPIYFWTTQPVECGIPLSDALHSRVKRLNGRDQTVFEGRGPSVSIRLEWPGYRPWSRQIPTKDFKSPPGPITLAKLAKNVAKCVQRFIEERRHQSMDEDADPRWRIGPGHITIENIVLVSMHHVSLGSWQPQLRLRYPFHGQWN